MDRKELESRTRRFAIGIIRFTEKLPRTLAADVMGRQLLRSGTAVGALYREAARAETRRDFVHKIGVGAKEAAECQYWLELFAESGVGDSLQMKHLMKESDELLRILIASGRTARARLQASASAKAGSRSVRSR